MAGEIVAVNDNKMVVVLNDLGFCNRLMRYENFVRIIEILDKYNSEIIDYICLPKVVWNKIKVDYKSKYSLDNPKVSLEKISIGVLRRKEPTQKEESDLEKLYEFIALSYPHLTLPTKLEV